MKKILALLLSASMLTAALAGCAGDDSKTTSSASSASSASSTEASSTASKGEPVALTLWGSQEDQEMLQGMVDSFKAANTDKEYDIKLGVVGEPDLSKTYLEDPAAAADVFAFANDQLKDMVKAGGLYEVTKNKDAITAANTPGSIESATVDGSLYAYPMTADNGYFMYYDKSVINDEQAKTLDGILKACNDAGKKAFFDLSNGWYIASFFLGAGGKLGIDADGKQTCDFNNANGLKAGEAIKAFAADPAFLTGDDSVLTGGFGDTIAMGVSGTWNADAIKSKLGDNYAAGPLPTVTMGGEQVQLASFAGYKLVGVNSQTKNPVEAMALAEWLTNEENQKIRFDKRAMGPSNVNVANSEAVKANVALAALAAQSAYAVPQNDVLGGFWSPTEAFGTAMEAKDYSTDLQTQLDTMVSQIVTPVE